jgi:Protein of unknown function (DUF4058)
VGNRARAVRSTKFRPELLGVEMNYPFPGIDPYLEHPVLWEGVHARLMVAIANQLQPKRDPRYVTSIEERVYIEGPQRRVPDVWIQRTPGAEGPMPHAEADSDTAVIVEVDNLEIHETRVEILDWYNDLKLVALIEAAPPPSETKGANDWRDACADYLVDHGRLSDNPIVRSRLRKLPAVWNHLPCSKSRHAGQ